MAARKGSRTSSTWGIGAIDVGEKSERVRRYPRATVDEGQFGWLQPGELLDDPPDDWARANARDFRSRIPPTKGATS